MVLLVCDESMEALFAAFRVKNIYSDVVVHTFYTYKYTIGALLS